MRVRFTTAAGLPVVEESTNETVAFINGILIHPDTAKIEGFFVRMPMFLHAQELFLSVADIRRWGTRVHVHSRDVLSPFEEMLRLQTFKEEGRPVLGQRILTESGTYIGKCSDVQFDTSSFYVVWLLPRRWWKWGMAIPVSSVMKVKREAIIVRDAITLQTEATGPSVLETLDPLGTTGVSRTAEKR